MKNKILVVLLTTVFAGQAFAQTAEEIAQSNRAAGLGLEDSQQYKDAQAALAAKQAAAEKEKNINQNAKKGEQAESGAAAMNMAASAMLMAACMASKPPNMPLCIMGAMAAMQAGADKAAASDSAETFAASQMGYNTPAATAKKDDGSAGFNNPTVDAGMETLKAEGYGIKEGGVTFPDGSFKPNEAFSSAASMAAAGMDPKAAGEAAKVLAGLNTSAGGGDHPTISGVAVDGGGGGYSQASAGNGDSDNGSTFQNPWAMTAAQRRKLVEGKSMNLAGEPIGVKGDDLFDMVHRAYDKKRKTANFIENDASAVNVRFPASVKKPAGQ